MDCQALFVKKFTFFCIIAAFTKDTKNKPFGFEVQDYRIGGLIKRVEHCEKMIMDYVNGKSENIALLDEKCLDFYPELIEDGAFNSFALNISTSIV